MTKNIPGLVLLLLLAGNLMAQNDPTAQMKLLARRAAIADGYRQLAEGLHGVKITAQTRVSDFVAQNDQIAADLDAFLLRAAQVTATRYRDDGTCEVEMILPLADLVSFLTFSQNRYNLSRWRECNFRELERHNGASTIRALGTGATTGRGSRLWQEFEQLKRLNAALREEIQHLKEALASGQGTPRKEVSLPAEDDSLRPSSTSGANLEVLLEELHRLRSENASLRRALSVQIEWEKELAAFRQAYPNTPVANWELLEEMAALENNRLPKEGETHEGETPKYTQLQAENAELTNQVNLLRERIESLRTELQKSSANEYWASATPQQKLMARRAAIADGYRQLTEMIKGVRIDASTTVQDFITVSDIIQTSIQKFLLRGAQTLDTRYLANGTCEVEMQVPLESLVKELQQLCHQQGVAGWKPEKFAQMLQFESRRVFKVVGTGTF